MALESECGDLLTWRRQGVEAGLHLPVVFQAVATDDLAVSAAAARLGLRTPPLSNYYMGLGRPGLVLGFASTAADRMDIAVRRLRRAAEAEGER